MKSLGSDSPRAVNLTQISRCLRTITANALEKSNQLDGVLIAKSYHTNLGGDADSVWMSATRKYTLGHVLGNADHGFRGQLLPYVTHYRNRLRLSTAALPNAVSGPLYE